jgi:hypothetical protein
MFNRRVIVGILMIFGGVNEYLLVLMKSHTYYSDAQQGTFILAFLGVVVLFWGLKKKKPNL